jgi:hypothetical protein
MISKPLAVGLLASACVAASAGGAYLAVRQNATVAAPVTAFEPAVPPAATTGTEKAVAETEAVVTPVSEPAVSEPIDRPAPVPAVERETVEPAPRPVARRSTAGAAPVRERPQPRSAPPAPVSTPATSSVPVAEPVPSAAPPISYEAPRPEPPPAPPAPRIEELVIPSASVMGLRVDTSLSSERAQVEDKLEATVTRDVTADGLVAIPAGTRVLGSVTLVERGGKVKERARLGVRFHTLVLADGTEQPIRTETIFREGASPSAESSKKIGGAAIGGAILGAIMGGGKGAIVGGAAGAGAGTAAVMAGDRNAATLSAGTIVNARLSSPVTIQVERR